MPLAAVSLLFVGYFFFLAWIGSNLSGQSASMSLAVFVLAALSGAVIVCAVQALIERRQIRRHARRFRESNWRHVS